MTIYDILLLLLLSLLLLLLLLLFLIGSGWYTSLFLCPFYNCGWDIEYNSHFIHSHEYNSHFTNLYLVVADIPAWYT